MKEGRLQLSDRQLSGGLSIVPYLSGGTKKKACKHVIARRCTYEKSLVQLQVALLGLRPSGSCVKQLKDQK